MDSGTGYDTIAWEEQQRGAAERSKRSEGSQRKEPAKGAREAEVWLWWLVAMGGWADRVEETWKKARKILSRS
jgi:hypothetical protein